MARKRMLDPGIWESEQVMSLSDRQFKLYVYLISHADDRGRQKVSYPMIASRAFPMDVTVDAETVQADIEHMHSIDLVLLYGDGQYLLHPNWTRYQTINRPTESRIPTPDECSVNAHGGLSEDSVNAHGGLTPKRIEENRREVKGTERAREVSSSRWGDDSLEHRTIVAFQKVNPMWSDYPANLNAVPELVKLCGARGDPNVVLPKMIEIYHALIDGSMQGLSASDRKFWARQPFTPKGMMQIFERLYAQARSAFKDHEKSQRVTDWLEEDVSFG